MSCGFSENNVGKILRLLHNSYRIDQAFQANRCAWKKARRYKMYKMPEVLKEQEYHGGAGAGDERDRA